MMVAREDFFAEKPTGERVLSEAFARDRRKEQCM